MKTSSTVAYRNFNMKLCNYTTRVKNKKNLCLNKIYKK